MMRADGTPSPQAVAQIAQRMLHGCTCDAASARSAWYSCADLVSGAGGVQVRHTGAETGLLAVAAAGRLRSRG
jgi:hypothetical protein